MVYYKLKMFNCTENTSFDSEAIVEEKTLTWLFKSNL